VQPAAPEAGLIRELEEASLDGLPALATERYDGWVMRTARGYSRRANSIWPIYPSSVPLDEKLARCEAWYASASHPCTFKLTEASQPFGLDAYLEGRGYQRDSETCVHVLELPASPPVPDGVELVDRPDGDWISTWSSLADRGGEDRVFLKLLRALQGPSAFVLVRERGRPVACARATLSGSWLGLFELVVAPDHRRRGLGRRLALARLAWGRARGARRAFAQVMAENTAARALQASLGFAEAYRYWYRTRPS
jgi:GNAT superfamily N-acetyltransferase